MVETQALSSLDDKMKIEKLNVFYGAFQAIKSANLDVPDSSGHGADRPSGCGKSTFIRALNRMHDLTPGARVEGSVTLDGTRYLCAEYRSRYRSAPHRHGISAPEPVS